MNVFEEFIKNANKNNKKTAPQDRKIVINRDVLKDVISHLKKQDKLSDEIRKSSKRCILTTELCEDMYFAVESLLKEFYGEEVDDLISWWLYEDVEKTLTKYVGKKEIIHDVTSLDNLVDYIIKEYSL